MKGNAKDYVSAAQQFFTAFDAHDVDGMLALCADGALGRYAPYGRESVVPIRGGIDVIWRAFPSRFCCTAVKIVSSERSYFSPVRCRVTRVASLLIAPQPT
jgi:hypothetical protein